MISAIVTVAPVKNPKDGRVTSYLTEGVTIYEAQGGVRVVGPKGTFYIPWSNISYAILDVSSEAAIVEPPVVLEVPFPPAEEAPEAPIVKLEEVAKPKRGPFGRPLKTDK